MLADCLAGADKLPFIVDLPFVMVDRFPDIEDEPDVPGESPALARDTVVDGGVDDDRIRLNGGPLNKSSTLRGSGRQGTSDLLKFPYVFIILLRLVKCLPLITQTAFRVEILFIRRASLKTT